MIEVPTVRRRLLGAELRRLREGAGFSLDGAARILECDRSKISRIETGHRGVRPKELRELLAEYGVEEKRRYALADLARQAGKRGWWRDYADVLAESYLDYLGLEAAAASLWTYESQAIPGLLQTEDYARAIAVAGLPQAAKGGHDQLIAVLKTRRQALIRDNPLHLQAIVSETVLRQPVGGPAVMRAQLERLLEAGATLPNVTVRILPFAAGAPAAHTGPFVLLMFPEPTGLAVVHLQSLTGGLFLEDPKDVERHVLAHEHLSAAALPLHESADLIDRAARAL
ncbi:MAG TPA: helix-turn-helix transcriptional regulator [Streptosporangiaceae bacterium]|jgi:transcriptional regulator with XRE-family HTH domain|nr:helix-turn-helix transcriptional regulator [Streptosporangiaceae bacterium]